VFFVECRHPAVKASDAGRVGLPELWLDQFLVALDAVSGEKVWEKAIDTTDGTVVFYMIHANGRLIIATSDTQYNLHAFDDESGEHLWDASHAWTGADHSGHMQHPCVVGNTVYLEPCGYDIASGERVTDAVGRHEGCATYAGTETALIYRGAGRRISMWNVDTGETTNWTRLRPACWLSTIAGGGMVLSPEGGGGCSCGNWMETSLAFARREAR
jgi:outer membrane protein assembly factor BamB